MSLHRLRRELARRVPPPAVPLPEVSIVIRCVGADGYFTGEEIHHTPAGRVEVFNAATAGTRCPNATTPDREAPRL